MATTNTSSKTINSTNTTDTDMYDVWEDFVSNNNNSSSSCEIAALVPTRHGKLLFPSPSFQVVSSSSNHKNNKKKLPFLVPSNDAIIGRPELLMTLCRACGCCCSQNEKLSSSAAWCQECKGTYDWATRFVSRKLFRLLPMNIQTQQQQASNSNSNNANTNNTDGLQLLVLRKATFPLSCMFLNDTCLQDLLWKKEKTIDNGDNEWMGPVALPLGSDLTFRNPQNRRAAETLSFQVVTLKRQQGDDKSSLQVVLDSASALSTAINNDDEDGDKKQAPSMVETREKATSAPTLQQEEAKNESDLKQVSALTSSEQPQQHPSRHLYARALKAVDEVLQQSPDSYSCSESKGTTSPIYLTVNTQQSPQQANRPSVQPAVAIDKTKDDPAGGHDVEMCQCEQEKDSNMATDDHTTLQNKPKVTKATSAARRTSSRGDAKAEPRMERPRRRDECSTKSSRLQNGSSNIAVPKPRPARTRMQQKRIPSSKNTIVASRPSTSEEASRQTQQESRRRKTATAKAKTTSTHPNERPLVAGSSLAAAMTTTNALQSMEQQQQQQQQQQHESIPESDCVEAKIKQASFVLYFVKGGVDMSAEHLDGPTGYKEHARRRGACVLETFDKNYRPWPTHFVVGSISVPSLVEALGFESKDELELFLGENRIHCVKRKWATKRQWKKKGNSVELAPFRNPQPTEEYLGVIPKRADSNINRKRPHDTKGASSRKAKRRLSAEESQDDDSNAEGDSRINLEISEVFHKLSKLYQHCPLDESEEWKAYTFHVISGRIKRLPFQIENDRDVLKRLKDVRGIGSSSMEIVKQVLETGTCERLKEFDTNPQRIAMKQIMDIWGIGRSKATELVVKQGYMSVEALRQAVEAKKVKLTRQQLIGLECYEDILERMSRDEVEKIYGIISGVVKEYFPLAELQVMGSFRREKQTCGDIDILITHPHYIEQVPPHALGEIVDKLKEKGHIAHHLTSVSGMRPDLFESLPETAKKHIVNPEQYGNIKAKKDKFSSSMYMGVVNSPVISGKRRRVDIKFYPYRERIFAALYFTGNGHFNRSMRFWADKKRKCKLSDHGLFELDKTTRVSARDKSGRKMEHAFEPTCEKDVFDYLGLVWKEPFERDGFDAVEPIDGDRFLTDVPDKEIKAELREEKKSNAKWVE